MDLQWLLERVKCHDTDLYYGKGKEDPPLTQRVATLESWIQEAKRSAAETAENTLQTRKMMKTTIISCLGTLATGGILTFVVPAIKHLLGH